MLAGAIVGRELTQQQLLFRGERQRAYREGAHFLAGADVRSLTA